MNKVMNSRIPQNAGNFLSSLLTASFSRRTIRKNGATVYRQYGVHASVEGDRNISVGVATRYGLDGPGIEAW